MANSKRNYKVNVTSVNEPSAEAIANFKAAIVRALSRKQ